MSLTIGQMLSIFGAGALVGMAGLLMLAGVLSARSGDQEGGCFGKLMALLTAAGGLALLIWAIHRG